MRNRGVVFESSRKTARFCSRRCKNYHKYKNSPLVLMEKGDIEREIKYTDVNAYKKSGWVVK
jgi:hypothetical protein